MTAVDLPGARLFLALWGGLAVVVVTRPLPDQLLALALLVCLAAHHQSLPVALAAGGIVALVDNGFVVHQDGLLAWTSGGDLLRTAVLVVVGGLVSELSR